ncbi:replication initiation protein [Vibrio sp. S11_S32]|uniref:replication initiation protein n=1 Tax=Vibrio sp. S11_S32 TaxID=2720225 RepID=UPI00168113FA|nr:replication initiation protein [Vibrio sp. S11_S32]MBD1577994.1 replication initiation protein [Vibrio sp. S11_S32]
MITKPSDITVNQSNELLSAQYTLPLAQFRIVLMGLAKINSGKSNAGSITITTRDFSDAYGYDVTDCAQIMRDAIKSINKSPINMTIDDRLRTFHWFEVTDVPATGDDGAFNIQFSKTIEPFIFELKNNYSISEFKYVKQLTTLFQFRLYQWLKDGQFLGMNNFKVIAGGALVITYEIEWMKARANIVGYEEWSDFKKRILQPSIDHINSSTNLSVIYKPVKTGRKTTHIEFTVVKEYSVNVISKPIRPRLKRRPKVVEGSDAHGQWARTNIDKLVGYESELKNYDSSESLSLDDVRRLVEYYKIIGSKFEQKSREREISDRLLSRESRFAMTLQSN